jgi:UDP-N-acetylmuramoyl-L-alanyl-D-glutamate--2,6-diaminopimelate ligase
VAGRGLPADITTPDSLRTAELMRAMADGGDRACVMEVSSHALSLARVDRVRFDAAVFTNISQDHLDFHGTMEEYLKAKLRLLELLKPGGTAVIGSASPEWPSLPGSLRFGFLPGDDFRILRTRTGFRAPATTSPPPGAPWRLP